MITNVSSEKMIVISDLHLGNPFSRVREKTSRFIRWASENGYDLCINGDGFELTQISLSRAACDVPEVLQAVRGAVSAGVRVYYVVGNHDIFFEHFLSDWGGVKLAPFLNVVHEGARFRVEHGHLYDPFFVRFPRLYEAGTWFGGLVLKVHPALYRAWIAFERMRSRFLAWKRKDIPGEPTSFRLAAEEIEARGFDGVVFGHTHHRGDVALPGGGRYVNPGSWMLSSTYVKIESGRLAICDYEGDPSSDN